MFWFLSNWLLLCPKRVRKHNREELIYLFCAAHYFVHFQYNSLICPLSKVTVFTTGKLNGRHCLRWERCRDLVTAWLQAQTHFQRLKYFVCCQPSSWCVLSRLLHFAAGCLISFVLWDRTQAHGSSQTLNNQASVTSIQIYKDIYMPIDERLEGFYPHFFDPSPEV